MQKIEVRVKTILDKSYVLKTYIDGKNLLSQIALKACIRFFSRKIVSSIVDVIESSIKSDLEKRQLLKSEN
jgi:hypothetical protein